MISSGSGFNTRGCQKGCLRYNVDDGITYQYIGGSAQDVSSWRAVFGSEAYAQLSNVVGTIPVDTNPYWVMFHQIDEIRGRNILQDGGTSIVVEEKGIYAIVNGVQVAKTGGGGTATYLDHWIRKNGIDVPNTGVRLTVPTAAITNALMLNWVGSLEIGDSITKHIAVSNAGLGIGLYAITNSVGPIIPAGIFSIMKIQ